MSHTITLRHASPAKNTKSILSRGLDPAKSQTARPEVWLHSPSRSWWAMLHSEKRHQTSKITLFEVRVKRSKLTRRGKGLWTCTESIPADAIHTIRITI